MRSLIKEIFKCLLVFEQNTLQRPVMLDRPNLAKERVQFLPLLGPDLINGASNMRIEVLVSNLDAEQLNDRYICVPCDLLHF